MRKQLAYIVWLIVGLTPLFAQAQFALNPGGPLAKPSAVDSLLAEVSFGADSAEQKLDLAAYIAENISYDAGVAKVRNAKVDYYRQTEDIVAELKAQWSYLHYVARRDSTAATIEAYEKIGEIYFDNQLYDLAMGAYDSVQRMADPQSDTYFEAILRLGHANHLDGSILFAAPAYYEEGIAIAKRKGRHHELLWLYQQLADINHQQELYEEEIALYTNIIRLTDSLNLQEEKLIALNNLGFAYKFMKDGDKAEAYFNQVITALGEPPHGVIGAEVKKNRGILFQNEKRFIEANNSLLEAARDFAEANDHERQIEVYQLLAIVDYQANDFFKAHKYIHKAIQLSKKHQEVLLEAQSYLTQSRIYQSEYDYENALRSFKKYEQKLKEYNDQQRLSNNIEAQRRYSLSRVKTEVEAEALKVIAAADRAKAAEAEKRLAEEARKVAEEKQKVEAERARAAEARAAALEAEAEAIRLRQQQAIQTLELAQARARRDSAERERELAEARQKLQEADLLAEQERTKLLEQESQLSELQIQQQQDRIRNMAFLLGGLLLALLIILFAYRQLRKKNAKIAEQQTIIAAEKDKSDQLLLNILPPAVAAELKEKGAAAPRSYDEVTVVFTDFSGFTQIAEKLSAAELVETLNKIFLEFDLISEKYGLERIKTIGDAYMCAAGLPDPDPDHAVKAVSAALEMRDYIQQYNTDLSAPTWKLRVGVNTGHVVAGVVGKKKFAYDIWGDAVNLAARMESSGQIGKVNISQETYARVKDEFTTESRGKVEAKNKGQVEMYFVEPK